jgi:hypothetical protein
MADIVRIIAIGGTIGGLVAGSIAAPAVFAGVTEVPAKLVSSATITDLFPPPFDPGKLRKYAITFDPWVSTTAKSQSSVTKIGYGEKSVVSITNTPTGTYSSDGIVSPYVRYPGVDVAAKGKHQHPRFWSSTFRSNNGTARAYGFSSGSFTYFTYKYSPRDRG